jgi:hypothetical protein
MIIYSGLEESEEAAESYFKGYKGLRKSIKMSG